MVTNSSGLGQDLAEAGQAISDGAHSVGEALGLVEGDVISGDPAQMASVAEHLTTLGNAFERAGQGFKAIDAGGWRGEAAEGFEDFLAGAPPRWFRAADSFSDAGAAVRRYSEVLADAKRRAAEAKTRLEQAEQASEAAAARHNAAVQRYNSQVQAANPTPGARPGTFVDPAAEDRAAAEHTIDRAKQAVRQAGAEASRTVLAALQAAPAEPGLMTRVKANFMDSMSMGGRVLGSVAAGAGEAVAGLAQLARMVAPLDPYRLTHPAQANEAATTLAAGLAGAVKDPYAAIKTTVDVDGWRNQPGRTLGSMIPDAVASLAGGAGVASRATTGLRRVAKGSEKLAERPSAVHPSGHQHAPEGPPRSPEPPHMPARAESGPEHRLGTPGPDSRIGEALQPERPFGLHGHHQPDAPDPVRAHSPGDTDRGAGDQPPQRRMFWDDEDFGAPASWMDNGSGHHDPLPDTDDLRPEPDTRPPHHDDGPHGHDGPADQDQARGLPERGSDDRPSLGELFPGPGGHFDEHRAMQVLSGTFGGKFGDLNVSIREVSPNVLQDTSSYAVYADIVDDTGRSVGKATHDVYRPEDGGGLIGVVRSVHVDPHVRGAGFGSEFSRAWEDWLTESGADRIHLRANVDVGSYSWARQGFDFANEAEAVNKISPRLEDGIARNEDDLAELTRQREQPGADHEALSREIESREQLLINARDVSSRMYAGCDEFPTPREISELGRPDGLQPGESRDAWWLGKDVLMDPTGRGRVEWQAVKKL